MKEYAVCATILLTVSAENEDEAHALAWRRLEGLVYNVYDVNDVEVSLMKGE